MYLHLLRLTARVSISCVGNHHYDVPTFTAFYCMGLILCMGDLFALRAPFPPPCTYIHCMGFNSLHGSQPLPCTYIHCMGSIPCMGEFFALMVLSPPPFLHSLCQLHPLCTASTAYCMGLCTAFYCMGSILCMGNLFALRALSPLFLHSLYTVWG